MARRSSSADKTKRMLLAGLGVVFATALVYQIFFSGPAPRPRRNLQSEAASDRGAATSSTSTPATPRVRQLGAAAQQEAHMQALLSDMTPLNLRSVSSGPGGSAQIGKRGNIFAYYVEPPKPPPPPPPPPPIQLVSVQPSSVVAGTPRPLTLTISGNKIPADAQIILDGTPRVTKRLTDNQLSTVLAPGDFATGRNINIEVKSQSNPAENSNSIMFMVQQPPEPGFIYRGRLGTLGQPQSNYAVIEVTSTKEIKRVKVGDTLMGSWRIDGISGDALEIMHTQYEIKRRIPLQEKGR